MNRFKVGDRVRWGKVVGTRTSVKIGGIFIVESVNEQGQYTLVYAHGAHARDVPEDQLDLAEESHDITP
jgi:hypothetical protein